MYFIIATLLYISLAIVVLYFGYRYDRKKGFDGGGAFAKIFFVIYSLLYYCLYRFFLD